VENEPAVKGALSRLGLATPTTTTVVVHHQVITDIPAAKLWEALEDIDRWPRWSKPWHERARWLEKRNFEFGARFEQVRHQGFPIGRQVTVETVREVSPGTSVAWWDNEGGIKSCRIWHFETTQDGKTRVSSTEVFRSILLLVPRPLLIKRWNRLNKMSVEGLVEFAKRAS
jgi:Polyketide cyclase / dehydrase and lipid transport